MSDATTLEGLGVRVVFRRLADRFSHAVEATLETEKILLLESVEGTSEDDWPASPPLQELHFENRPDGSRLALLVGRAGRSHWSLSIEAAADSKRLVFDAACRVREAPQRLGSEYRLPPVLAASALGSGIGRRAVVELSGGWRLTSENLDGAETRLEAAPSGIAIRPSLAFAGAWPQTARWQYIVELA